MTKNWIVDLDPAADLDATRAAVANLISRASKSAAATVAYDFGSVKTLVVPVLDMGDASVAMRDALAAIAGVRSVLPELTYEHAMVGVQGGSMTPALDSIDGKMDGVYRFDTEGGLHATVYVLDSGINADHSEFGNFDGSPGSRASMNYTTIPAEPLTDAGSHGTGVAAVIGGRDSGVAKQTTLVGIKVMSTSSTNATSSGLLAGLLQVYNLEKNSPRPRSAIVNLSLATTSPPSSADTAYPEEKAIQQLMSMGIPVVVAAGNDNVNACRMIPARVKGVITVAGTAYDPAAAKQVRWEKSNYGKCVQIFAPATGIRTADAGPQNSEFAIVQGTSFAAPYVSGALAVLISQGYTGPQAWSYLKARAQIDGVSGISQGEPNLFLRLPPAIDVNPDPPVFGAGTDADVFDSGAWSADGVALDAAASGNGNGNGGNPAIGSTASAIGDTEGGGGISTGGWVGIAIGIVAVVGAVAAVVATKLVRRRRHQRAQWTPVVAQD